MSEFVQEMKPLTPLGQSAPRIDQHGPVTLTEVTDCALASFATRLGQEVTAEACLASFLGDVPPAPGKALFGAVSRALWIGPDQWLVMAPYETHEDLAEQLAIAAKGAASVTEQTDAWCRFDLMGAELSDVFALLCPINMPAWSGGEGTRTTIDHLGCFVMMQASDHVTVLGPRSSAGSLHHALLTAMRAAL